MTEQQQNFVDKLLPFIIVSALENDILASVTIAQAIIESNCGTSILATNGYNFFGIKANSEWSGPSISNVTGEVINGDPVKVVAAFRSYKSISEGVADHGKFLLRSHYSKIWGVKDYKSYCIELKAAGYATALDYDKTLINKIEQFNLDKYDKIVETIRTSFKFEKADVTQMRTYKVFLSPSSQEYNKYIVGNTNEENVCNMIADQVQAILENHNIIVAQNDHKNSPSAHASMANEFGPDIIVPIHTNAGGGRGCEVFCYNKDDADAPGTMLAQLIYKYVSLITPTSDRGVKTNKVFTEILKTKAPVAYVEVEYHDSKDGATWILNNIKQIAIAISKGILDFFGIEYKNISYFDEYKVKITATYLRVRRTPDSSVTNNVIKSLKGGTVVVISEVKDGWGYVALEGGWVFLKYVSNM